MTSQDSIILTYKSKILLFSNNSLGDKYEECVWDFVSKQVLSNTGIKNAKIQQTDKLYHAQLTDDHVNKMERKNGSRLEFYRLTELDSIRLSKTSQEIYTRYKDQIKDLLR